MDTGARDSIADFAALVGIARTVEGQEAIAEAVCTHVVAALGLAGASVALVRYNGEAHLESIAAVGQLSPFIRELSTPLGAATDAGKIALGGEPLFVGNPHGVGEGAGPAGVGRWRNGFGSHAYALLALNAREGVLGVLSLEWPEPREFSDAEQSKLQLLADVTALVLRQAPPSEASQPEAETIAPSCADAHIVGYAMNARGLVVLAELAEGWLEPPAALIWTAATAPHPDCAPAFSDAMSAPDNRAVLAVGLASLDADEDLLSARAVVRAAALHGSAPAEALGMFGASVRSHAPNARVSAVIAAFEPYSGALEIALAGGATTAILRREGRFELAPIATQAAPSEPRVLLALPGDRIALLTSGALALADPARAASIRAALDHVDGESGEHAALELLAQACEGSDSGAVAILHLPQRPSDATATSADLA